MNRLVVLLAVAFTSSSFVATAQATLTVCNIPDCPAAYSTIGEAIGAASAGDIIHVLPSPIAYGDVTIDKSISLLGSGHAVDALSGSKPILGTLTVEADDVLIGSLELQAVKLGASLSQSIENVVVRNNRFFGSGRFIECNVVGGGTKNWTIEGNVFTPDAPPNSRPIMTMSNRDTTWDVRNNYIEQYWPYQRVIEGATPSLVTAGHLFRNNLIYASGAASFVLSSGLNISAHSNIFWVVDPMYSFMPTGSSQMLHFQSNVLYCPTGSLSDPDPVYGNEVNTNPTFEHLEGDAPEWNYDNDFNLAGSSPVVNLGLGGQDPGLYGSLFNFSMSGYAPGLPRFTAVSKAYEILPAGETLELDVEWNTGE